MSVNIDNIPTYVRAQSPQGLRRLMLRNNIKHGAIFEYKIMLGPDSYWYAWFQLDYGDEMLSENINTKEGEE